MTTIIFSSLSKDTLLAFDLISLTTSPAFHGIRNVPPGPHFLFTGTDAGHSVRHGVWFIVPRDQGNGSRELLFQWHAEQERLIQLLHHSPTALARPGEVGLRDQLGGGLVDYIAHQNSKDANDNDLVKWQSLTSYIDAATLSQILSTPSSASDQVEAQSQLPRWTITSTSSSPQDIEAEIPGIDPSAFTKKPSSSVPPQEPQESETETLNLLPIDLKRTWRDGAIGRERTEAAQDRSWALADLLDRAAISSPPEPAAKRREAGAKRLLAELQFTFLITLLLGNYSCLEQWKRITSLLFTCRNAVREVEGFFVFVLKVLETQVRCLGETAGFMEGGGIVEEIREEFAPGGMGTGMGMTGGRQGRMRKLLEGWRKGVEDLAPEGGELWKDVKALWALCREEFGWEDLEGGMTVLKRGMVQLEDGEQVELSMEGADEEDEMGEYAPVIVDLG